MKLTATAARLCCGLALLALLGCHTYAPYGPYRYGYPPGGAYPPGNYVNPPPAGSIPQGVPNLGTPGTIPDNGNNGVKAPTPSGASTGNKPPIEANRNGSGLFPNEKPVPNPGRVDSTSFPGSSAKAPSAATSPAAPQPGGSPPGGGAPAPGPSQIDPGKGAADPKTPPNDAGKSGDAFPKSPFGDSARDSTGGQSTIQQTGGQGLTPPAAPGKFHPPKTISPAPLPGITPPGKAATTDGKTTAAPNPYDYDEKKYAWLRGKLDYDDASKTWHIIYSLSPDAGDQYGGSFTLVDHAQLKKMQSDDVVLIEGKIDPAARDARNKPCYRIDTLFGPLVPKNSLSKTAPDVFPGEGKAGSAPPVRMAGSELVKSGG